MIGLGSFPGGLAADVWTFVTYALLHGSWTHLILNSVWLLAFGTPVARRFGAARFLAFFAVTAAGGALAHLYFYVGMRVPMIGASAAISGFMAAAIRFAFQRGGPLRLIGNNEDDAYRVPALPLRAVLRDPRVLIFLGVWFGLNLLFGLGSLGARRQRPGDRLAGAYRRLSGRAAGLPAVRSGEARAVRQYRRTGRETRDALTACDAPLTHVAGMTQRDDKLSCRLAADAICAPDSP